MSFAEVLGQETLARNLADAIAHNRVNSAYLFCGPEGTGKNKLIRAFAQALLCADFHGDACGKCACCRLFAGGGHPDFLQLIPEKNEIAVAEMRLFCREISVKPTAALRRVCVVSDAEKLNDASANCFLKTLEEPPGEAVLLLRAESHERLLRTIVSRCQVARLCPLPTKTVAAELMRRKGLGAKEADALALLSEGALGRALALSGGSAAEDWAWVKERLETLSPGQALAVSDELVERAQSDGTNAAAMRVRSRELIGLAAMFYRSRLRSAPARRDALAKLERAWEASEALERNVTPELALRNLALGLARGF